MWDGGFTEYVHDWWNLMDFAMNSLYLATISLKIVAYVKVRLFPCPQKKSYVVHLCANLIKHISYLCSLVDYIQTWAQFTLLKPPFQACCMQTTKRLIWISSA